MRYYERRFHRQGFDYIIGIDEAGRGPLAGPVVAAAVRLAAGRFQQRIDDSKKLTPRQREVAYFEIIRKAAYGLGIVSEKIIDRLNIRVATRIAMEDAVRALLEKACLGTNARICLLVDGDMPLELGFPCLAIIGGDGKSKSIAAASILAKVTRDRLMVVYDQAYPVYGFARHKGYPTAAHRSLLKQHGPSPIHRLTFAHV